MSASASFSGITNITATSFPENNMLMLMVDRDNTIFFHGLAPVYAARLAQAINQAWLPEDVTVVGLEAPEKVHSAIAEALGE